MSKFDQLDRLYQQRDLAVGQLDWLQKVNTLHRQVDILYVVDGYEVTVTWDDNPISEGFHGETVAEAISKAMAGFDLDARHQYQDRDIYGHERQMAALAAQRDELLAALEGLVDLTKPILDALLLSAGDRDSILLAGKINNGHPDRAKLIAKAKGGAA